ncbi:hypothetical protein QPK87_22850 [Kamptonema cortianum]|nr:hypothetical protein [Oscillatoria laete-virens]MDK3159391.1 hypothetical protein [Kamptonema cortianum]MDL5054182.1 hypothetical protein [Oscillatoria laete-virens NRMC-F 0139]
MQRPIQTTHQKALEINLDLAKYGTFAEIGAGQEVVRWFFQVGGAAGTVAKSMSAYDMTVSDAIYGKAQRYVCRERLEKMLDHEYELNIERLKSKRGATTQFFAFANTVAARGYKGNSECHGWMGIRFQPIPQAPPSQIVVHVRMWDKDNLSQQQALGIVGVNLIYAAFYYTMSPDTIMESLLDNLSIQRIEVDMIEFDGPIFNGVDHRLMTLKLVQIGLTNAAMFAPDGKVLQPSELLYKKPIILERGSFRPVTYTNIDILHSAHQQFITDLQAHNQEQELVLMEITMKNLLATSHNGEIDYQDFLARADMLATVGKTVLISNYFEYFRLAGYLRRFTKEPIGITLGAKSLNELFDEKYYETLEGGILESFGRLFKNDIKVFVYPFEDETGKLITAANFEAPKGLQDLYNHLLKKGCIVGIEKYNPDYLKIFSRNLLQDIQSGKSGWETSVPPEVATIIKERGYLGYRPPE